MIGLPVQSGTWELAVKLTLNKSLAKQKGSYGMGLLPTKQLSLPTTGPGRAVAGLLTWQPIDEPCQLFFRDVGPTEVKANWLPLDDATESLGYNSLTPTQVNFCPKSLVTAPVVEGKRSSCQ